MGIKKMTIAKPRLLELRNTAQEIRTSEPYPLPFIDLEFISPIS